MNAQVIYIIDDDEVHREILKFTLKNYYPSYQIEEFVSGNDAISSLKSKKQLPALICCDYDMSNGNGFSVYKVIRELSLTTPFLLITSRENLEETDFQNVKMNDESDYHLIKPVSLKNLKTNLTAILSRAEAHNIKASELDYIAINYHSIMPMENSRFELYIKLFEDKYVKVLNKGDNIDLEFLKNYLKKQIKSFYITKNDQNTYLDYLYNRENQTSIKNLKSNNIEAESTFLMARIADKIQNLGINSEVTKETERVAKNILNNFDQKSLLFQLISKSRAESNYIFDHSYLVACICIGISQNIEWCNETNNEKLVSAAIFHDILIQDPHIAAINDKYDPALKKLTNKEVDWFLRHPIKTKELLDEEKTVLPNVSDIVLQHHERPDGTGFPRGLSAKSISPLSKIFIVAHDFIHRMYEFDFDGSSLPNIMKEFESAYKEKMFREIVSSLKTSINFN